jgi:hypothetical protein
MPAAGQRRIGDDLAKAFRTDAVLRLPPKTRAAFCIQTLPVSLFVCVLEATRQKQNGCRP